MKKVCWQDVIEEHGSLVWKVAFRLLGNETDAADCFQDVFLAAVKISRTERIRNYAALLTRLATTRAIDRLRQRIREIRLIQTGESRVTRTSASPAQAVQQQETLETVRQALAQLPNAQAQAFCLKHFHNMTQKQIGQTLGITGNAAGVLVHRARVQLETLLTPMIDTFCEVH